MSALREEPAVLREELPLQQAEREVPLSCSPRAFMLVAALLAIVLLIPLAIVVYPPLSDYPMHLARCEILTRWRSPFFHELYDVRFTVLPNLAVDLIVPFLTKFMAINTAGKLFLAITLLSQASGAAAIAYALDRRLTWRMLFPALIVYNDIFAYGFMSYSFGIGFALWGVALWILFSEKRPMVATLLLLPVSVALFIGHLVPFALFIVSLGLYEIGLVYVAKTAQAGQLIRRLAFVFTLALPGLILYLGSTINQANGTSPPGLARKLYYFFFFLDGNRTTVETALALLIMVLVLLLFAVRSLSLDKRLVLPIAGTFAIYMVLPFRLHDSHFADIRLSLFLFMLVAAGLVIKPIQPQWTRAAGAAAIGLLCLHLGLVIYQWKRCDAAYRSLASIENQIPNGSVLLPVTDGPSILKGRSWNPPLWLAGDLSVLNGHDVFLPQLWLDVGQQPVMISQEYRPDDRFPMHSPLDIGDNPGQVLANLKIMRDIYRKNMIDSGVYTQPQAYVLYIRRNTHYTNPFPADMEPVSHDRNVSLFRMRDSG